MRDEILSQAGSPLVRFFLSLILIGFFTMFGPAEKALGSNVRVVYLHGAWVWSAMVAFVAAGVVGLVGLVTHRTKLHTWSRALGRTGLFFWITYLPISLWAMRTNWNGLFLAEPRWRIAVVFAIGGILLQSGLSLIDDPAWASGLNFLYMVTLFTALQSTEQVMHPASPILASDAWRIQLFFAALLALTLVAAWQITRWWHRFETVSTRR
jgi:hypothetical protein